MARKAPVKPRKTTRKAAPQPRIEGYADTRADLAALTTGTARLDEARDGLGDIIVRTATDFLREVGDADMEGEGKKATLTFRNKEKARVFPARRGRPSKQPFGRMLRLLLPPSEKRPPATVTANLSRVGFVCMATVTLRGRESIPRKATPTEAVNTIGSINRLLTLYRGLTADKFNRALSSFRSAAKTLNQTQRGRAAMAEVLTPMQRLRAALIEQEKAEVRKGGPSRKQQRRMEKEEARAGE